MNEERLNKLAEQERLGENDKINFQCIDGCGACCYKIDILLSVTDIYNIALETRETQLQNLFEKDVVAVHIGHNSRMPVYMLKKVRDDVCEFMNIETKRCTIYKRAPKICRIFPLGKITTEDSSKSGYIFQGDISNCPGINCGKKQTLKQFKKKNNLELYDNPKNDYSKWAMDFIMSHDTRKFQKEDYDMMISSVISVYNNSYNYFKKTIEVSGLDVAMEFTKIYELLMEKEFERYKK